MSILNWFFPRKDKQDYTPKIVFDTDTNYFGEHGKITVTHLTKRIIERPVRFAFIGMTKAPSLSEYHFHLIFEAARDQGYIPHEIVEYGRNAEVVSIDPEVETNAALTKAAARQQSIVIG